MARSLSTIGSEGGERVGVGVGVKWVETRRDGSTSRDRSVAPRQPCPTPRMARVSGLEVSGRQSRYRSRDVRVTRSGIVVLGFGSRRSNRARLDHRNCTGSSIGQLRFQITNKLRNYSVAGSNGNSETEGTGDEDCITLEGY